jgi:hypothetical protein
MAGLFGLDPDLPIPDSLRSDLQKREAFKPIVWDVPANTPAWRILARELALFPANDEV